MRWASPLPSLHCSSQIGMTKIMEIYKARNIYSRSYDLFRDARIQPQVARVAVSAIAPPWDVCRSQMGALNDVAHRCPPTPPHQPPEIRSLHSEGDAREANNDLRPLKSQNEAERTNGLERLINFRAVDSELGFRACSVWGIT